MIITLMGAPGSGKGTQGRSLASSLGIPYLASGDLIRRAMADRSRWGEQVRSYIERGLYVPDGDIVPVFLQSLVASSPLGSRVSGVLDGFPRTAEQALALDKALGAFSPPISQIALVLDVPEDVLIARLSGRWLCSGCNASYNVQSHPPIMVGGSASDGSVACATCVGVRSCSVWMTDETRSRSVCWCTAQARAPLLTSMRQGVA